MKNKALIAGGVIVLTALFWASFVVSGQSKAGAQRFEYAIIKWDGTDTVQVMTPAKSEVMHVWQAGGQKAKEIPEEEYCVTWVANKLAQEGWDAVNLNNRRILMQRAVSR